MFNITIMDQAKKNEYFRQVLNTGQNSQVVVMSVPSGGDIGMESHKVDQILVFVEGEGEAILDGKTEKVTGGSLVFVPAGVQHNFVNIGVNPLKLYTIYAPPEHPDGIVHKTKEEAAALEQHS